MQHGKDGGRVEHTNTRSCYKTNQPPSYIVLVDHIDENLSEMFHSILGLKISTSFSSGLELNSVDHQHLGIELLPFMAISML